MVTADEKNHVLCNANEKLDRQIIRLDTAFLYIAGEISEEARLGSLAHWAYSNNSTAKAATNGRPCQEAVNHRQNLKDVPHEAQEQFWAHSEAGDQETRSSPKTNTGKSCGDNAPANESAAAQRRKVERPPAMDMGMPMECSVRGTGSQRIPSKDAMEKKRLHPSSASTAVARKKYVF